MTDNNNKPDSPDKLAPNDVQAEEALLGSVLIASEAIAGLLSTITADDFFILRNGWIWQAMVELHTSGKQIDNLTVVSKLRDKGQLDAIGGSAYITGLLNSTPTHIHVATYAAIVQDKSTLRKMLGAAGHIAQAATVDGATVEDVITYAEQTVQAVAQRRTVVQVLSGEDALKEATDDYAHWRANPSLVRGPWRCGIPQLDRAIGGWLPGRPYGIIGATGMGKSTFLAYIAVNFMLQAPILVASTELNPIRWIHRAVANLAGISLLTLMSGELQPEQEELVESIYIRMYKNQHNLHFIPMSNPAPDDVYDAAQKLKRNVGIQAVFIDSINNVGRNPNQDIYSKTTAAANMAARLGVDDDLVVLMTTQMGRNAKTRKNLMPEITDPLGSGAIENNSEMLFGIHRQDYWIDQGIAPESSRRNKDGVEVFPQGGTVITFLKNGPSGKRLHIRQEAGGFTYAPPGTPTTAQPAPVNIPTHYTNKDSDDEQ